MALTVILLGALPLVPAAADAFALERAPEAALVQMPEPEFRPMQSDGMTLSQAIESVRKQTGGRVVSAETKIQGGREVHHIKVLMENGKVKTFKINGPRV